MREYNFLVDDESNCTHKGLCFARKVKQFLVALSHAKTGPWGIFPVNGNLTFPQFLLSDKYPIIRRTLVLDTSIKLQCS